MDTRIYSTLLPEDVDLGDHYIAVAENIGVSAMPMVVTEILYKDPESIRAVSKKGERVEMILGRPREVIGFRYGLYHDDDSYGGQYLFAYPSTEGVLVKPDGRLLISENLRKFLEESREIPIGVIPAK